MATKLHVELGSANDLRVIMQGDRTIVTEMLATAMLQRPDIAAAFITAVVLYLGKSGGTLRDIKRIADTYGYRI